MSTLKFSLTPFPAERNRPEIRIAGSIGRRANRLSLVCTIQGDLSALAIPAPAEVPKRKDRLWEETCLELFLGASDSEGYWEFNLSPAGHWNVYRFTSYREGMQEEPAFASFPLLVRKEPEILGLSVDLDIGKILPASKVIVAGVNAVTRTTTGTKHHWAAAHPGPRPDFHRRDGFTLNLAGE